MDGILGMARSEVVAWVLDEGQEGKNRDPG